MNQPTVQFQGPIRIPGVYNGHNRTFFMYALDLYRDSRPNYTTMLVPTDLERAGDFSQTYVSGTSGATISIYDPLSTVQNGSTYTRHALPRCEDPDFTDQPDCRQGDVDGAASQPQQRRARPAEPHRYAQLRPRAFQFPRLARRPRIQREVPLLRQRHLQPPRPDQRSGLRTAGV